MTHPLRSRRFRLALLSSVLLVGAAAASDDECTALTYEDAVVAALQVDADGTMETIEPSADTSVSLVQDTLTVTLHPGGSALTLTVDIPARVESDFPRMHDFEGTLCEDQQCSRIGGAVVLFDTTETCSSGDCDDGFSLALRGRREDGRAFDLELTRKVGTEPTSCTSSVGCINNP